MDRVLNRTPSQMLESLALHMPHAFRQWIATYKSWQIDQMRRGGNSAELATNYGLQRIRELSWQDVRQEQDRHLIHLLKRAAQYTPYYHNLAKEFSEVQSATQLDQLPTLSKAQAREAGRRLFDTELQHKRHLTGHTSGTTGSPFTFKLTLEATRIRYMLRDNFYAFHGFDFSNQVNVRMGGRLFVAATQKKPPFWIFDRATKQLMFSLYHMSDENLATFVEPLLKYHPPFVTGYPSAIYLLAKFCHEHKVDWQPTGVFTDSETVLDYQREAILAAWGCKVHDYYGMEVGWIAGQCEQGKYHLSPQTSIVEILNEDNRPTAPGEAGELVISDLTNLLMPLIRYKTGDIATWSPDSCDCGWNTPTIEAIEGRMDDTVTLADGRRIGRLDHIFKMANNITECQIIQESSRKFIFLIVPETDFGQADRAALLREAYIRLGDEIQIEIQLVDRVPRTSRGKFRSVISKVKSTP